MTTGRDRESAARERSEEREVLELTFRLCDGGLDEAELGRLIELVETRSEHLAAYRAAKRLHFELESRAAPGARAAAGPPVASAGDRHPKIARLRVLVSLAAAVLVVLGIAFALWATREPALALVSAGSGATADGELVSVRDRIGPGPFHLRDGWAELTFENGVRVRLTGPASCEILSERGVRLHEGRLEASIPAVARGFSVLTKDVRVIDDGTQFAVVRGQDGTDVYVIDGQVRTVSIDAERESAKLLLGARQAMRFGRQDRVRVEGSSGPAIILTGGGLELVEEGGTSRAGNLALHGVPFALDELQFEKYEGAPIIHFVSDLNDGKHGNSDAWIGNGRTVGGRAWAGISFEEIETLGEIAFGRDNEGVYSDRTLGIFVLEYTRVRDARELAELPFTGDPDTGWARIGTLDYRTDPGFDFSRLARRHRFRFDPVLARAVRLVVPKSGIAGGAAIDEIELYRPEEERR